MLSLRKILAIKPIPVFRPTVIVVIICACALSLLLRAKAAQRDLPRDALWQVVHNLCVPGESQNHNPKPCLQVDLKNGIENGFAILRDPRGGAQFLLIPTTRIPGIESPIVRAPSTPNYFAIAWEARNHIEEALHMTIGRDEVGLAINSVVSRSQDQLHIHFSCIRADVQEALHNNESNIRDRWTPFDVPLFGRYYMAVWVQGEHLGTLNPFRLLAERLPDAAKNMGDRTLVVVGFTRRNGAKGFVILTDRFNKDAGDLANGEELLDHTCQVVTAENRPLAGPTDHGTK